MAGGLVDATSGDEPLASIDAWVALCGRLTQPIALIGVIGMLGSAGFTVLDVLLRWLAKGGFLALNEVIGLIFAVAIAATLPSGLARGVNITIDMLAGKLGDRQIAWLKAFGDVCLMVFFATLTWRMGLFTADTWERGRSTVILQWPEAPFLLGTTILLGLSTLVQIVMSVKAIETARRVHSSRPTAAVAWVVLALLAFTVTTLVWIAFDLETASAWARDHTGLVILFMVGAMWVFMLGFVPLGAVMGLMGVVGGAMFIGTQPSLSAMASEAAAYLTNYQLATLPLFLLMGGFAARAGIANDLYGFASAILGSLRGGLAMATIAACAGFGAVTGSSLATVATFGGISMPEMRARRYDPGFSSACIAAGGTLGALIPPSGPLILFALLTEASIGQLFIAAILPGVLTLVIYLALVAILVRIRPDIVSPAQKFTFGELFASARRCGAVLALFGAVIGGMYGGIFSATEAASVGAFGAFVLALARGRMGGGVFWKVMAETTASTAMIYGLILGVAVFSFFVDASDTPAKMSDFVAGLALPSLVVVILILVVYLFLGCIMDSYSVMIVTVPIVTAVILNMGYDLVWWGIVNLAVVEIGLITPPFGMHLFVLRGMVTDVSLQRLYREILPFCVMEMIKLALLVLFPIISLWLPSTMAK